MTTEPKVKDSNWGGARKGAGAKKTSGIATQTVRVQKELVPLIKQINKIFKETGIIPELK